MAGTQEYMAMEKLGQLRRGDEWDLIVVDTPPSRSALDFLDAPKRLGSFLDGRVIKILAAPAKAGGRGRFKMVSVGINLVTNVVTKVLGAQLLRDVQAFIAALDTMFGGFRERADATYKLLKNPETRFLVVAAPEPDALREASYFVERLSSERMPLAGLVLNRVHRSSAVSLTAPRSLAAAEDLDDENDVAAGLLRLHADRMNLIAREQRLTGRFTGAHPGVAIGEVQALPGDVHDLAALRTIGADLAGAR
jgi:anion-transporting  ArsA/GET3 family ATPase